MTSLAILLIGFSLFASLVLALTHFRQDSYASQPLARAMGLLLLLALSALQLAHFVWLQLDWPWVFSAPYRMLLFVVAPAFYLFSAPLLDQQGAAGVGVKQLGHGLPLLLAPWLSSTQALPLAFIVGAGYLLWLGRSLYALRQQRAGFQLEIGLLGAVFAIAVAVAALGLLQAALPAKLFYGLYASAIGLAFVLVQITLGLRPQLTAEVSETVQATYSNSTLTHLDCDALLATLDQLMQGEHLYQDAQLNLPALAQRLGVTTHQLSELLNGRLGKGFSRYLREQRVAASKQMLCAEPTASVLSVGLSAGFTSQSNFYEAFREIEGMTPGQYRKLHA